MRIDELRTACSRDEQLYMPLMLPCFIDQAPQGVARDFLIKTTYWPRSSLSQAFSLLDMEENQFDLHSGSFIERVFAAKWSAFAMHFHRKRWQQMRKFFDIYHHTRCLPSQLSNLILTGSIPWSSSYCITAAGTVTNVSLVRLTTSRLTRLWIINSSGFGSQWKSCCPYDQQSVERFDWLLIARS